MVSTVTAPTAAGTASSATAGLGPGGFRVLSLDLLGMDELWALTLSARDPGVAAAAVSFLTSIQHRLSDALLPRIGEFRRRYVSRCMAYIRSATAVTSASGSVDVTGHMGWPWEPASDVTGSGSHLATSRKHYHNDPASSPSASPSSHFTASAGVSGSQLIERCVALLDSLLDETEEETYSAVLDVRDAARRLQLLRSLLPQLSSNNSSESEQQRRMDALLTSASAALRTGTLSHAPTFAGVISPGPPGGPNVFPPVSLSAGTKEGYITLVLNVLLPVSVPGTAVTSETGEAATTSPAGKGAPSSAVASSGSGDANMGENASAAVKKVNLGQVKVRLGLHERASEIRSIIGALTGYHPLDPTFRVVVAQNAFSVGSVLDAARIAAAAAGVTSAMGAVPLKGHLLGYSLGQLGLKDGGIILALMNSVGPAGSGSTTATAASDVSGPAIPQTPSYGSDDGGAQLSSSSSSAVAATSSLSSLEACEKQLRDALTRFSFLPVALLGSDPRHISLLLSLVEKACAGTANGKDAASGSAVSKIWRLLCRLPTNSEYSTALTSVLSAAGNVDASKWANLLPSPCDGSSGSSQLARLLYATAALSFAAADNGASGAGVSASLHPSSTAISRIIPPSPSTVGTSTAAYAEIYERAVACSSGYELAWQQAQVTAAIGGASSAEISALVAFSGSQPAAEAGSSPVMSALIRTGGAPRLLDCLTVLVTIAQQWAEARTPTGSSPAVPLSFASLSAILKLTSQLTLAAIKAWSTSNASIAALLSAVAGANCTITELSATDAAGFASSCKLPQLGRLLLTFVHSASAPSALAHACEALTSEQVRALMQSIHSALLMWVALCVYDPAGVWGACVADVTASQQPVVTSFAAWALAAHNPVPSSGVDEDSLRSDSNVYCRLRATSSVALLLLALHTPSTTVSSSSAYDPMAKTTPGGHVHPLPLLLRGLFASRPTHASFSGASPVAAAVGRRAVSTYYCFLEVLLRLACQECARGSGATAPSTLGVALPPSLRAMMYALTSQLKSAPPVEVDTVARQAYGDLSKLLSLPVDDRVLKAASEATSAAAAGGAIGFDPVPLTSALAPEVLLDPVTSSKQYITGARLALMSDLTSVYAVPPMHPMFTLLGNDQASANASDAAGLLSPSGTGTQTSGGTWPVTSGTSQALAMSLAPLTSASDAVAHARQVALLQAGVTPFDGSPSSQVSEEEVVASHPGVDHILAGTMRLATVLAEADPSLCADVGSLKVRSDAPWDLTRFLFSTCLFPPSPSYASSAAPLDRQAEVAVLGHTFAAKVQHGGIVQLTSASTALAPPGAGPACHSIVTRRAAMRLLVALTRRSGANLRVLGSLLAKNAADTYGADNAPLPSFGNSKEAWRLEPLARDTLAHTGYAGIKNLGCICYMNAREWMY